MKFKYSFQKIVDVKLSEKEQAERVLSHAVSHLVREEQRLYELNKQQDELRQQASSTLMKSACAAELRMIQNYAEHLIQQIEQKIEHVDVAKHTVSTKRINLQEKMREEEIWNKAREKAYGKYVAEMRLKEQNILDEMATNRFKR